MLAQIKCNQFNSFYILSDNYVYLIVLKSYKCDNTNIDFYAITISKYTPE